MEGTGESTLVMDSPVLLMHHDPDTSILIQINPKERTLRNTLKSVLVSKLALLQKMCTIKLSLGSCAVLGIDEVKAKNVLPFGQQSDQPTQITEVLLIYQSERGT